jgi:hypothetical protein
LYHFDYFIYTSTYTVNIQYIIYFALTSPLSYANIYLAWGRNIVTGQKHSFIEFRYLPVFPWLWDFLRMRNVKQAWLTLKRSSLKVIYCLINIFFIKKTYVHSTVYFLLKITIVSRNTCQSGSCMFLICLFCLYSYVVNHEVKLYISINSNWFQFYTNLSFPLHIVCNFNYIT